MEPAVIVQAHPEVVDLMYDEESPALANIETRHKKRIVVRPRGSFHQEQFDIFGTSLEALAKGKKGEDKSVEKAVEKPGARGTA